MLTKGGDEVKKRYIELMIGAGGAALVFLWFKGIDMTPLLILGGVVAALIFLSKNRIAGGTQGVTVGSTSGQSVGYLSFDDIGGQEVAKKGTYRVS